MSRIEWIEGQYGSHYGSVNGLRFFTISYTSQRGADKPYLLRTSLPIKLAEHRIASASREAAKYNAEQVLNSFIKHLGARWKESDK